MTYSSQKKSPLPWYKVPVLWIGLVLTFAMIGALVHLIYVSHNYENPAPVLLEGDEVKTSKDIKAWRGTPLAREEGEQPNHQWQRFEPDNQELRYKQRKAAEQKVNE